MRKCSCEFCELWCGECYANARRRANYKGHVGYRRVRGPRGGVFMKHLRRPSPNGTSGPVDPMTSLGVWLDLYPALSEFLTDSKWDDGMARKLGTLTLFFDDGSWKVCLNDKDSSCVAFVSAGSPTEALSAAETGLASGVLDWRLSRPMKGKRG